MAGKQLELRIDRVLYAEFLEVSKREKLGRSEAVEALVRVYGKEPEQVLTREALLENAATAVDQEDYCYFHSPMS